MQAKLPYEIAKVMIFLRLNFSKRIYGIIFKFFKTCSYGTIQHPENGKNRPA
jgi:uncharacterized membrane protein required for colicin V production